MSETMYDQNLPRIHSIMTLVFTKDGDLVITKNGNQEIDTVPQYFLGRSQNVGEYDENNIGIINSELDYKTSMAKYLGKQ